MNVNVDKLENGNSKITVTIPADTWSEAVKKSYNKNKKKYNVPGFRKGQAPQLMIEKYYGEGVFFEDAMNDVIDGTYSEAVKESGLDVVSKAKYDVEDFGKGKDFVYTAEVATRPEVELGEYKGLELEGTSAEVTDEDVDKAIQQELERNSRLVSVDGRAAEIGDTVVIDFDGSIDGVHFEGGKAEDYSLELGSHQFIEGFEDQVAGHSAGESFDVNVTFPENYGSKELAGKPAVFAINLKEIKTKELPELDDEFAGEVSEFDTLDEYKEDVRKKLTEQKEKNAKIANENAVIGKVSGDANVELPELMIETKIDEMMNGMARQMAQQGLNIQDYMKYTGMDMEKMRQQCREQAVNDLKTGLVLEAIAKKEAIEVTDEEVDADIKEMAEAYNMKYEDLEKLVGEEERENIRGSKKIQKAVDMLVEGTKFN